ncbi:MAG: hypothetical protein KJP23_05180 [Deltaproteobacteria bacterium]|nr:hypothetical protein [Deltaproteobacteria bacterium]
MAEKARELLSDYRTDKDLTNFTDLDGEDFLKVLDEVKKAIKAVTDSD